MEQLESHMLDLYEKISLAELKLAVLQARIADAERQAKQAQVKKVKAGKTGPADAVKENLTKTSAGLTPAGAIFIGPNGEVMTAQPTRCPNGKVENLVYCPDGYTRSGKLKPFKPHAGEKAAFEDREREFSKQLAAKRNAA